MQSAGLSGKAGALNADHPQLVMLGRFGWLAKGVVYTLAGILTALFAARAPPGAWSARSSRQ